MSASERQGETTSRGGEVDVPKQKRCSMCGLIFMLATEEGTPRRSFYVALVVGTILTLINQGTVIFQGKPPVWWKVILTYIVPFCVSTCGQQGLQRRSRGWVEAASGGDEERGSGRNASKACKASAVNRRQAKSWRHSRVPTAADADAGADGAVTAKLAARAMKPVTVDKCSMTCSAQEDGSSCAEMDMSESTPEGGEAVEIQVVVDEQDGKGTASGTMPVTGASGEQNRAARSSIVAPLEVGSGEVSPEGV